MVEENKTQEFRFKTIDERRNYFVEKIKQNDFMSKKYRMVCTTLNYIEILASAVTGSISISDFASRLYFPIGIMSSAIGLKICTITAEIKCICQSLRKRKKGTKKVVLLAKSKLNSIEV